MDTKVMAPAITTRRLPPAMTELRRFLSEGVTAASATSGLDMVAMTAAVTAAGTATATWLEPSLLLQESNESESLCRVKHNKYTMRPGTLE